MEEVGSQREPLKEMMDKELIVERNTSTMTIETRGLWDGSWFWVQTPTSAIEPGGLLQQERCRTPSTCSRGKC